MSGPDRRDTIKAPSIIGGPVEEDELGFTAGDDYSAQIVSHRRAYHVRADVELSMAAGAASPAHYYVLAEVESEFKGREASYEWNGQPIYTADDGVRISRSEYIALDVAGEFITEED